MGYYRGDYYRARGDYYRGDFASILGTIGNLLPNSWTPAGATKVGLGTAATALAGAAATFAPGLVKTLAPVAANIFSAGSSAMQALPPMRSAMPAAAAAAPSGGAVVQLPSGQLARVRRRYRRMNPGNIKAARRSLRRIRSVGKLMSTIKRDVGKAATSLGVHRTVRMGRKR